jgi:DNA replication protein DnaC
MTATTPPPLPADLTDGLKRLKMAAMRRLAPELLVTAKTQRWTPEEFLRTLIEAEIAARDASNQQTRMRQAGFPVVKTLAEFDLAASSVPAATFDYLSSLEWIRAAENLAMIGPAGTGKSHMLLAVGVAAVEHGYRVRYFTAADLVDTLYRGLADNSVGRVIDTLLRNDLILVDLCRSRDYADDSGRGRAVWVLTWAGGWGWARIGRHSHRLSRKARSRSGGR